MSQPAQANQTKTHFHTSEGVWRLGAERLTALVHFANDKTTKVTVAQTRGSEVYLVYNVKENVFILDYNDLCQDPARAFEEAKTITFSGLIPSCHAYCPMDSGHDLAIGMHTGEVVTCSLATQLADGGQKLKDGQTLNNDDKFTSTRVTSLDWSPARDGTFVASYGDGCVYFFDRSKKGQAEFPSIKDTGAATFGTSSAKSSKASPHSRWHIGSAPVNEAKYSPDGSRLATVGRDGVLRVFDVRGENLISGCRSYYGALLCLAWSPDGRLIVVGGEDDFVAVYSTAAGCIVAWGEGHQSFVSGLEFDVWWRPPPPAGPDEAPAYRFASVAQDACMIMWEMPMPEDIPGGGGAGGAGGSDPLAPSPKRADVPVLPPVTAHRIHSEPLSGCAFLHDGLVTACAGGQVKAWQRPRPGESRMSEDRMSEG